MEHLASANGSSAADSEPHGGSSTIQASAVLKILTVGGMCIVCVHTTFFQSTCNLHVHLPVAGNIE